MALTGTTVPGRADSLAQAVIMPWRFLTGIVRRGVWSVEGLAQLLRLGYTETIGPLAAAWASLRRAQVTTSLDWDQWTDAAGRVLLRPLCRPRAQVMKWIGLAFKKAQIQKVARRRQDFAHLAPGLDHWASCRWLRGSEAQESTCASLRAVMTGSLVTQSLASK